MDLTSQIIYLFVIAIPVSCIAWTVTHEEIFREPREYCQKISRTATSIWKRKFFYLFTCEYCFSHYVSLLFIIIGQYQLLYAGWRGYLVSFFAVVWVANWYMSLFGFLRQSLKVEKIEATIMDIDLQHLEEKLDNKVEEADSNLPS
ncbi:hypothetical protein [Chryseobacterium sp. SC28]|uniref:hypothetical protein n=1 Tax=Chryseobacterium sp. SC28 TaxID=2268028 RepID=UPI000F655DBC|nr:hypothetical protein [Chryseobacterium sp. SC28]RRQ45889.1 hypothetical protein DTW91_08200 [Chryseobacterium sp. SC28]